MAPASNPGETTAQQSTISGTEWLCTGDKMFPAMLSAIDSAERTVFFEMYIYSPAGIGERFREALVRARERGAVVKVLLDALGSLNMPASFWRPLTRVGG